jgi:hypothetical protein
MNLTRITTVEDFLLIAPFVFRLKEADHRGKWEQSSGTDFVNLFFADFNQRIFYGEIKDNKLSYFCAIIPTNNEEVTAWLFYVDLDFDEQTTEIITLIKEDLKNLGFKSVFFTTPRIRSSYKRWAEKHGAKQVSITYKAEL